MGSTVCRSVEALLIDGALRMGRGAVQSLDTSTPAGKAMFQMLGVFSEFEREIIRDRVRSGLARAKAQGKKLGRPRRDDAKRLAAVRRLRNQGVGINKIARQLGIGVSAVQRIVSANTKIEARA